MQAEQWRRRSRHGARLLTPPTSQPRLLPLHALPLGGAAAPLLLPLLPAALALPAAASCQRATACAFLPSRPASGCLV